jgi:hypothetical protein
MTHCKSPLLTSLVALAFLVPLPAGAASVVEGTIVAMGTTKAAQSQRLIVSFSGERRAEIARIRKALANETYEIVQEFEVTPAIVIMVSANGRKILEGMSGLTVEADGLSAPSGG